MAKLKRKVTLRQKNATSNEVTTTPPAPKKLWWPWAIGVMLVCGGLVFFLTRGDNTSGTEGKRPSEEFVEAVTAQDNPTTSSSSAETKADEFSEEQPSTQSEATNTGNSQNTSETQIASQQAQETSSSQPNPTLKPQATKSTIADNTSASRNVSSTTVNGTAEEEAWRTIRGNYGNGLERREALGSRYDEIQSMVNKFYREGKVY